jgi:hypothetical protein
MGSRHLAVNSTPIYAQYLSESSLMCGIPATL